MQNRSDHPSSWALSLARQIAALLPAESELDDMPDLAAWFRNTGAGWAAFVVDRADARAGREEFLCDLGSYFVRYLTDPGAATTFLRLWASDVQQQTPSDVARLSAVLTVAGLPETLVASARLLRSRSASLVQADASQADDLLAAAPPGARVARVASRPRRRAALVDAPARRRCIRRTSLCRQPCVVDARRRHGRA